MCMLSIKINVISFKRQNCNNIMTGKYVLLIKTILNFHCNYDHDYHC